MVVDEACYQNQACQHQRMKVYTGIKNATCNAAQEEETDDCEPQSDGRNQLTLMLIGFIEEQLR